MKKLMILLTLLCMPLIGAGKKALVEYVPFGYEPTLAVYSAGAGAGAGGSRIYLQDDPYEWGLGSRHDIDRRVERETTATQNAWRALVKRINDNGDKIEGSKETYKNAEASAALVKDCDRYISWFDLERQQRSLKDQDVYKDAARGAQRKEREALDDNKKAIKELEQYVVIAALLAQLKQKDEEILRLRADKSKGS